MNKRATITAAALISTAGIGLGAAQLAMADPSPSSTASASSSGTQTQTATPSQGADSRPDGPRGGHGMGGVDSAALAKQLGLDETKVSAAVKAADESVRDTSTRPDQNATEAQREAARTAHEKAFAQALAKQLGISESKVTTAIDALQASQKAERLTALKAKLDTAVKAGTLTQTEADAVVKAWNAGVIQGDGGPHGR